MLPSIPEHDIANAKRAEYQLLLNCNNMGGYGNYDLETMLFYAWYVIDLAAELHILSGA